MPSFSFDGDGQLYSNGGKIKGNRSEGFRISVTVRDIDQSSQSFQDCLLTLVNAGSRTFLGGIEVSGLIPGTKATTRLSKKSLLADEVERLGGRLTECPSANTPVVVLGGGIAEFEPFSIRPVWKGWCGGVVPADEVPVFFQSECLSVAPIAAAGLALSECFDFLRGANLMAGQRSVGINLLSPGDCWWDGQTLDRSVLLPQSAWLVGIGHLGQAYVWALASLPYPDDKPARLTLQDFDRLSERNMGTSLLCSSDSIGLMKTRVIAAWAEERGFKTTLVERGFGADFNVTSKDPKLMLCGVDNAPTRQLIEDVGFALVLEAGIGAGIRDFTKFRCHAFDGSGRAKQVFKTEQTDTTSLTDLPAYKDLLAKTGDSCRVVMAAGAAVGVPFVGAVVGALVIAEAVKVASGGVPSFVSYGNVADANYVRHVEFETPPKFRIGFVLPRNASNYPD